MKSPFLYKDNLKTERIRTRFLSADDIEIWAKFFAGEETIAFFQMVVYETHQESARHWIDRQLTRYAEQRYGMQALINKNTSAFVGMCGLMTQTADDTVELEVGYHV